MNSVGISSPAVIAIVSRAQALDKTAAILAQMKRDAGCHGTVVLELDRKARPDVLLGPLQDLAAVSDSVIVPAESSLSEWFLENRERLGASVSVVQARDIESMLRDRGEAASVVVLAPIGPIGRCGRVIVAWARKQRRPLIGFFKSLHDEGQGLTTVPLRSWRRQITTVRSYFRGLRSRVKVGEALRPHDFTILMTFSDQHERVIAPLAGPAMLFRCGYPLLYPAWQEDRIARFAGLAQPARGRVCVLFTRGQSISHTAESSVVSDDDCIALACDVVGELRSRGESWRIVIKPHPLQATDRLRAVFHGAPDVVFSDASAATVVRSADVVVATYSSTVIDAVAIGVPAIEYFFENEYFRRKHPTGSPFLQFGVLPARNPEQLSNRIEDALRTGIRPSPLVNELRFVPDFSRLWRLPRDDEGS